VKSPAAVLDAMPTQIQNVTAQQLRAQLTSLAHQWRQESDPYVRYSLMETALNPKLEDYKRLEATWPRISSSPSPSSSG
jgi:hypothetical protein